MVFHIISNEMNVLNCLGSMENACYTENQTIVSRVRNLLLFDSVRFELFYFKFTYISHIKNTTTVLYSYITLR